MTVREQVDSAVHALVDRGHDKESARLDAELLLAHALNRSRTWLYTWPEHRLAPEAAQRFQQLLSQRLEGQPVAYLTGHRAFWSLDLVINESVLVPRPETEGLVEWALEVLPDRPARLADLGTGSGCIALALASERPDASVVATELSPAAARVARENGERLGLGNVDVLTGSWCEPLAGKFDLIVSNPPYVDANDAHLTRGDLRFEPQDALTPGDDGLSAIRHIIEQAPSWLSAGGWLLMEHGFDQGPAVRELLSVAGYEQVSTRRDLAGLDRLTGGRLN